MFKTKLKVKISKDGPLWSVDKKIKEDQSQAKELGLPDPYERRKTIKKDK